MAKKLPLEKLQPTVRSAFRGGKANFIKPSTTKKDNEDGKGQKDDKDREDKILNGYAALEYIDNLARAPLGSIIIEGQNKLSHYTLEVLVENDELGLSLFNAMKEVAWRRRLRPAKHQAFFNAMKEYSKAINVYYGVMEAIENGLYLKREQKEVFETTKSATHTTNTQIFVNDCLLKEATASEGEIGRITEIDLSPSLKIAGSIFAECTLSYHKIEPTPFQFC